MKKSLYAKEKSCKACLAFSSSGKGSENVSISRAPKILMMNAHSIVSSGKMDDIRIHCATLKPDIVIITESWLSNVHDSCLFNIDGYSMFRCDRKNRIGGGVAVWVTSELQVSIFEINAYPSFCECLFLKIIIDSEIINLLAIYVPPRIVSHHKELNDFVIDVLDSMTENQSFPNVIIGGDLNDFDSSILKRSFDLFNKVCDPTRFESTLDIFLVSRTLSENYGSAEVGPSLFSNRRASHCSVLLNPFVTKVDTHDFCVRKLFDLRSSNVQHFLSALCESSFQCVYEADDVDSKVERFYSVFLDCLFSCIPIKEVLISKRDKPWMTPLAKDCINRRWQAYRNRDFQEYNRLKQKCKEIIKACKENWVKRSKQTSRDIWSIVAHYKGKQANNNTVESLISQFSSVEYAVDEINRVFVNKFCVSQPIEFDFDDSWCPLSDPVEVFGYLEKLALSKSSGADCIPNRIYKISAPFIAEPLCHIINSSVLLRYVPAAFKSCVVVPVPKKSKVSVENLRPITISSVPCKLLERHVLSCMYSKITSCIPDFQFAYKPQSDCTSALITIHNYVTEMLDSDNVTSVMLIAFDFSCAFDRVRHDILVAKLQALGFPSGFICWTISYLQDRYQSVRLRECFSSSRCVSSGCPQGSLLGPFLFVLYCFDIATANETTKIVQYADDVNLIVPLTKNDYNITDRVFDEFLCLEKWCSENDLMLNKSKTKIVHFKKKNYACNDAFLDLSKFIVDEAKVLGVVWDDNLSWSRHFREVESKCSQRIYLLKSLKFTLCHDDLWTVYYNVVEKLMLYSAPLFGVLSSDVKVMMKRIFRRCKRTICRKDCACSNNFESFSIKRLQSFETLYKSSVSPTHPLNVLIPPTSLRRINVPFCKTTRRQNCFPISYLLHLNGHFRP